MSLFLSHLSFRKRLLLLLIPLIAAACVLLYLLDFPITEEKKFDRFTKEVFRSELSGNTLSLHYTIADPAKFGLAHCEPSLGDASLQSRLLACASCENYLSTLEQFSYNELSESQQLTYDIFMDYLSTESSAAALLLYDEPLSPMLGIQAQLPVLLAEYSFRTKGDIEDYLALLTQLPDYFDSVLAFEREKAAAGLFMSDASANEVISQCRDFIKNPETNYLITIFNDKIDAISNLTADEKIGYEDRSCKALSAYVIPAYETLIDGISQLLGSGTNDKGLFYFPQGTSYYQYLVKSTVGDSRSIPQIEESIKQQMVADYSDVQKLLTQHGSSGAAAQSDTATQPDSTAQSDTATQTVSAAQASFADSDPVGMLQDLHEKIADDFPAAPVISCEVKYVHDSLKEYLSPAFYLTPAIDNYTQNVIYINPASNYSGIDLYTTLAHEGYPGHLYQSVFFNAQSPDLLRCILDTGGYVEGWATYVEMYSYSLWPGDSTEAAIHQKNRSFTLGLASLLDIGIHYHGYSLEDVSAFLEQLGFGTETARSLYQSILQAPANYLQYYVGYLNFQSLRDQISNRLGNRFSLKDFHQAVLETGPAPFALLEREVCKKLGV